MGGKTPDRWRQYNRGNSHGWVLRVGAADHEDEVLLELPAASSASGMQGITLGTADTRRETRYMSEWHAARQACDSKYQANAEVQIRQ